MATQDEILAQLKIINAQVQAFLGHIPAIVQHHNALGDILSELSQSVEGLRGTIDQAITRLGSQPEDLTNALNELARVTQERDAAVADDATDEATINDLTAQRDQLLADAQAAAQNINEETGRLSSALGGQSGPPPEVSPQSQVRT